MAFCSKCGAQMADDAANCPKCGEPTGKQESSKESKSSSTQSTTDKINGAWEKFNDTTDTTSFYDKMDIENNKVVSVLAYLSILVLIPLLSAKNSKFARFHTNQGLVLFICEIVISILACIPVIKWGAWIIQAGLFVLMVIGIINVSNGKAKALPLIGGIKILN